MHKGNVVLEKKGYKVIDCESCGFKHLDPVPSKEATDDFYKHEYYQKEKPPLLNIDKEKKEQSWMRLAYEDARSIFEDNMQNSEKRILDVGCGNGLFVQYMKDNGWEAMGIEPSIEAGKRTTNNIILNKSLEEFIDDKWLGYFDVLNLKEVLEHVADPKAVLRDCKKLLKKSGLVCIEVPNDFNRLQLQIQGEGTAPWWVAIPDHVNYFDFESMGRLLRNEGFEIIKKTTNFPMELFVLMGDRYIDDPGIGAKCHQKRMNMEMKMPIDLRRNFYEALADSDIGRSCIIYARVGEGKNGN